MKKVVSICLVVFTILMVCTMSGAESNVDSYEALLTKSAQWERLDYNCTYTRAAEDVLPDLFTSSGKSFRTNRCRVFGDGTGEVWLIYNSEVYRMWWSNEGYLVLTSTSDGLGYTGYGVFSPTELSF